VNPSLEAASGIRCGLRSHLRNNDKTERMVKQPDVGPTNRLQQTTVAVTSFRCGSVWAGGGLEAGPSVGSHQFVTAPRARSTK
jgi:hypothetical protein